MITDVQLTQMARDYAARFPRPNTGEHSWDQMCGNLMNRFGEYVAGRTGTDWSPRIYGPNAWDVAKASGIRNMDPTLAPPGAVHWWSSSSASGNPGHTARDLHGGGRYLFMATYALDEALSRYAIGIQSAWGYSNAKPFMRYQGWTDNYAGATNPVSLGSASGGTVKPRPLVRRNKVYTLAFNVPGSGFAIGLTGKRVGLPSMYHYLLMKRNLFGVLDGNGAITTGEPDRFNDAELDIISMYELRIAPDTAAVSVDSGKIAAAVAEALKPALGGVVVDYAKIAQTVEDKLKDEFTAIPGAVLDLSAKRLAA